jgi:hypothetical protein
MDIEISIKGKLTIPDDDLKLIKAQGVGELATILIRNGKEIKTDVREVYVKGVK